MSSLPRHPTVSALRRLCAAGCAALVLALTIFAASPNAHAWVHDADENAEHTGRPDDFCAIVLFADGMSLPLDFPPVAGPATAVQTAAWTAPAELFLPCPRYLRQPERGPPAS